MHSASGLAGPLWPAPCDRYVATRPAPAAPHPATQGLPPTPPTPTLLRKNSLSRGANGGEGERLQVWRVCLRARNSRSWENATGSLNTV